MTHRTFMGRFTLDRPSRDTGPRFDSRRGASGTASGANEATAAHGAMELQKALIPRERDPSGVKNHTILYSSFTIDCPAASRSVVWIPCDSRGWTALMAAARVGTSQSALHDRNPSLRAGLRERHQLSLFSFISRSERYRASSSGRFQTR